MRHFPAQDSQKALADYEALLEETRRSGGLAAEEALLLDRTYRELGPVLAERLARLEQLQPVLGFVEGRLLVMESWTLFHDPASEMAVLSVRERAELVEQLGAELALLERPGNAALLDVRLLREVQQKISSLFVVSSLLLGLLLCRSAPL